MTRIDGIPRSSNFGNKPRGRLNFLTRNRCGLGKNPLNAIFLPIWTLHSMFALLTSATALPKKKLMRSTREVGRCLTRELANRQLPRGGWPSHMARPRLRWNPPASPCWLCARIRAPLGIWPSDSCSTPKIATGVGRRSPTMTRAAPALPG